MSAERSRARDIYVKAVSRGDLRRPSACSRCGIECVPGGRHHDLVNAPLEVEWLCHGCHRLAERALRASGTATYLLDRVAAARRQRLYAEQLAAVNGMQR
jgi:hypothetical protein